MRASLWQYLKLRRSFKRGNWHRVLLDEITQLAWDNPLPRYLQLYTDSRHAISGFDKASVLELEQLCQQPKNIQNSTLQHRLLALKLEYNLLEKKELQKLPLTPGLERYPHLLASTLSKSIIDKQLRGTRELADNLDKRCNSMEGFLRQQPPRSSYCVVGNAPTELGKTQQSAIDECNVVFRFNRIHTKAEHKASYGSRTDAWVISPSFKLDGHQTVTNQVFVSGVSVFDKPSRYWQALAQQKNLSFYSFPKEVWYELVAKLQAPPTAGLLCIASLQRLRHPSSTLSVFGISRDTNSSVNHYGDSGKRSGRHNWYTESLLVNEILNSARTTN